MSGGTWFRTKNQWERERQSDGTPNTHGVSKEKKNVCTHIHKRASERGRERESENETWIFELKNSQLIGYVLIWHWRGAQHRVFYFLSLSLSLYLPPSRFLEKISMIAMIFQSETQWWRGRETESFSYESKTKTKFTTKHNKQTFRHLHQLLATKIFFFLSGAESEREREKNIIRECSSRNRVFISVET